MEIISVKPEQTNQRTAQKAQPAAARGQNARAPQKTPAAEAGRRAVRRQRAEQRERLRRAKRRALVDPKPKARPLSAYVPAQAAERQPVRKTRLARPHTAVPALVLCFTLLLGLLTVCLPKKGFSETENRVLAEKPAFTAAGLWNGSLFQAWETYFTDHFVLRNAFLRLHAYGQAALGKRDLNGVYAGKKGHLFLIPAAPEEADLQSKAAAVNAFAAAHENLRCTFALAPNAVSVQAAYLPAYAQETNQQAQINAFYGLLQNVTCADLYAPLAAHAQEYIYYYTDHHWTSLGAKYAFAALSEALGVPGLDMGYEVITAATGFSGTLAGKSGLCPKKDTVELYLPQTEVGYYVLDPATGEKRGTMYDAAALESGDKYAVFFGGNAPLTVIRTTAETGRRLLVFKDSYANAVMQFLYPYFDEIVLLDPRYFYDDLAPVINQYGITDALFLYNADTFWGDASLIDAIRS